MKTIIVVDDEQAVLQAVTDTLNIEGAVYHGTTVMSASLADSANLLSMVRSSIACSYASGCLRIPSRMIAGLIAPGFPAFSSSPTVL